MSRVAYAFASSVTQDVVCTNCVGLSGLAADVSEHFATQARVAQASPVGSVTAYAGATTPQGWLGCNGAEVSRTDFAALFAVVGTI